MHTKGRFLWIVPYLAFAWFGLTACAGVTTDSATTLVVGSDLDNMPFAGVDREGAPIGRDVEMMAAVAARLGMELEWRRMPFDALLAAAESGEVDVVCATIGVTPERAERVAFSRPYFETAIAAVVRDREGAPKSLAELEGRRVAAGRGTTSERAVRQRLSGATPVFENKDGLSGSERLDRGEVDALVMDGPAADALVAASGGALRRIGEDLDAERYALVVSPRRRDLVPGIDECITEMQRSGFMRRLDERYRLR